MHIPVSRLVRIGSRHHSGTLPSSTISGPSMAYLEGGERSTAARWPSSCTVFTARFIDVPARELKGRAVWHNPHWEPRVSGL